MFVGAAPDSKWKGSSSCHVAEINENQVIKNVMGLSEGDCEPKSITPPVSLQSDYEKWHMTHARKDSSYLVATINSTGFDHKK